MTINSCGHHTVKIYCPEYVIVNYSMNRAIINQGFESSILKRMSIPLSRMRYFSAPLHIKRARVGLKCFIFNILFTLCHQLW